MAKPCPWRLDAATSEEYNWALGNFTVANPESCSLVLTLTGTGPYLQSQSVGLYGDRVWLNISGASLASVRPSASLLQSPDKHPLFTLKTALGGLSLSKLNVSNSAGGQLVDPGVVNVVEGRVVLKQSSFSSNSGYAGVLLASGGKSSVLAQGCEFVHNSGYRGGVAALQLGASLVLQSCTLAGNSATTEGPAIYVETQATLGLDDCTFDKPANASDTKAPVYVSGGSVTCDGSTWVEVGSSTGALACHSIGPTQVPTMAPSRAPTRAPSRTPSFHPTSAPTVLYPTSSPTPWGTNMPSVAPGPDIRPQVPSESKSKAGTLLWVVVLLALVTLCIVRVYDSWRRSGTRHTLLQWMWLQCRSWGRPRRRQQEALLHTQLLSSPRAEEDDEGEVDFL